MNLTIVIPLFNEAGNITLTLRRLNKTVMPAFVEHMEVIVVDDCSTDDSAILAEGFEAENLNLKVLRLHVNSGKGEAVGAGIRASSGDTLAIQDADLELDPADLSALVEKIHSEGLDLVSGTRFRTGMKYPVHAMLAAGANRFFSLAASLITCRKVTDITCGHKVFRRNLYDRLNLTEKRFGFETELILKALRDKNVRYGECDVAYNPRRKTEGKKIRIKDGLGIMVKTVRYGLEGRRWLSSVMIAIILAFMTVNMLNVRHWKQEQRVIEWDAISYYAYLPAAFIYNDLSLGFTEGYTGTHRFVFWPEKSPTGKNVIKTTMGLSVLWLPFFGAAHLAAHLTGADTGGYSEPYKLFLLVSALFYLLIGLLYLRKILLAGVSDKVAAIVLTGFAFATNLYWYSLFQSTMSHVYSFALITAFIWYSMKWHTAGSMEHGAWSAVRLGLLIGLISLIRPTNVIIILFFILYGISSIRDIQNRITGLTRDYRYLIIITLIAVLVWVPQMIYWREMTGQWVYFSYGGDERFFFNHPAIIQGLFSFRKGLLIYTPLVIFAFAGLIILWKKKSLHTLAIAAFLPLNIYIIFSWWCWWYGGGFGQRAFIDSYALMAIPAAAL
ncbi:MAG TPA: glycosyltransferase family 2 protein, partial [Bacteroidales bacterium]|nr:glycosyltransferase family 2 protein [Bacteroidales bacterium]